MVDVEALAAGDLKLSRIEPELLEDRGVDIGDIVSVLDGVEADLVGRAMDNPPAIPPPAIQTLKP